MKRGFICPYTLAGIILAILAALGLLATPGCAQNTESRQTASTPQSQRTVVPQTQTNELHLVNGPHDWRAPFASNTPIAEGKPGIAELLTPADSAMAGTGKAPAGAFTQINFVWIDGSSAANPQSHETGTTTGTQTTSPTQDVTAKAAVDVPIGVALPGGIADVQGSATSEGQTSGQAKTSDNQPRVATLKDIGQQCAEAGNLLTWLAQFFGAPAPATTQKAATTQPAGS